MLLQIFVISLLLTKSFGESTKIHAIRLHPKQDLVIELNKYINQNNIQAASFSTSVGVIIQILFKCYKSLTECSLRYANNLYLTKLVGHFEIVSIMGTIGIHGQHIHISLGDPNGQTYSGHLPSLHERKDEDNCLIYTTAELIILEYYNYVFERKFDPETGFDELYIINQ